MPRRGQYKSNAKKRSVYQRKFNSRPEQKRRRAIRNKARRKALRTGKVKKGSPMDLDHGDRKNLSPSSIRVVHRSKNRAKNSSLTRRRRKRR